MSPHNTLYPFIQYILIDRFDLVQAIAKSYGKSKTTIYFTKGKQVVILQNGI